MSFRIAIARLWHEGNSVHARIHRLEQFIGTQLFARLPHGIAPNAKGELLPARETRAAQHRRARDRVSLGRPAAALIGREPYFAPRNRARRFRCASPDRTRT